LEDFIRRNQNRQLLEEINQAYQEYPADENEQLHLRKMRSQHRKLVMGEW